MLYEVITPTEIIKVGSKSVYVNLTEERARHGALLNVFTLGESLSDPDTGESLGNSEELIGKLRITSYNVCYTKLLRISSGIWKAT